MNSQAVTESPSSQQSGVKSRHAHFSTGTGQEPKKNEKILTIRYGKNQMALIRKRLRVEAWLYDSLELIAQQNREAIDRARDKGRRVDNDNIEHESAEIDIDIDQILDIESECDRRKWLQEKLKDSSASQDSIQKFIDEFLDRLKTL